MSDQHQHWITLSQLSIHSMVIIGSAHLKRGDGVAQLVEHRLEIQRPEVRTPSGTQDEYVRVFLRVKLLC